MRIVITDRPQTYNKASTRPYRTELGASFSGGESYVKNKEKNYYYPFEFTVVVY